MEPLMTFDNHPFKHNELVHYIDNSGMNEVVKNVKIESVVKLPHVHALGNKFFHKRDNCVNFLLLIRRKRLEKYQASFQQKSSLPVLYNPRSET